MNRFNKGFALALTFLFCQSAFAETSKSEIAKQLKELGYDVLHVSNSGDTALHLAVKKQQMEVVALALDYGISPSRPNKGGDTPLHMAAAKGNAAMCAFLIERGADIHAINALDQTPYHKALARPFSEVLALFEEQGYVPEDSFKDYLIASDLHPDHVDNAGNQLMHRLAKARNLELMRVVLEKGYEPFVFNKKDESPLTFAIKNQDLEMATLLLGYANGEEMSSSDLTMAIKGMWKEGIALLLSTSPNCAIAINNPNERGISPFHRACAKGDIEIIKLLIELGADLNQPTVSEFQYGTHDPAMWSGEDWGAFAEFSHSGDMEKYTRESGYVHPVISPLAILTEMHPDQEEMAAHLESLGAEYIYHPSILDESLEDYLE